MLAVSGDRSITYAEGTLGVHDVYQEAKAALADLRHAQTALVEHLNSKRIVAEQLADREYELVSEERAKYHEMSATAFEPHMRKVKHEDPEMKRLRGDLSKIQYEIDTTEAAVREHEFTCKVKQARMEELGGLLNFYAAVKTASVTTTQEKPT